MTLHSSSGTTRQRRTSVIIVIDAYISSLSSSLPFQMGPVALPPCIQQLKWQLEVKRVDHSDLVPQIDPATLSDLATVLELRSGCREYTDHVTRPYILSEGGRIAAARFKCCPSADSLAAFSSRTTTRQTQDRSRQQQQHQRPGHAAISSRGKLVTAHCQASHGQAQEAPSQLHPRRL